MFDWLGLHIPDWMYLIAAVVCAAVAFRYFGVKGAISVAAGFALLLARTSGQKAGAQQQQQEARRALDKTVIQATRARNSAIRDNASSERLRDNDGFRRD